MLYWVSIYLLLFCEKMISPPRGQGLNFYLVCGTMKTEKYCGYIGGLWVAEPHKRGVTSNRKSKNFLDICVRCARLEMLGFLAVRTLGRAGKPWFYWGFGVLYLLLFSLKILQNLFGFEALKPSAIPASCRKIWSRNWSPSAARKGCWKYHRSLFGE